MQSQVSPGTPLCDPSKLTTWLPCQWVLSACHTHGFTVRHLKPLHLRLSLGSGRASRQFSGNSNFQHSQLGLASGRGKTFPAPNIRTLCINHHTEGWSKEGMLGVATSLENSKTIFSLSMLCLIPLPCREWEGEEAPESCEQLQHSRFQPLIAESMF